MRAAAEVDKLPGGVKGNHRLDGLFLDQFALELLIRLAIELERLGLRNQLALVGNVFRGELVHLRFDFYEVFGSEWLLAHEFVEEAGVDRRADAELHVRVEFEHGGGEQMRGGVAEHLDARPDPSR